MRINVGDFYSTVVDAKDNARALGIIREVCKARPSGYKFMPKYRAGHWDGYISIMPSLASFPTGLLVYILQALKDNGYSNVNLVKPLNIDPKMEVTKDMLTGIELRDYQVEAANKMIMWKRGVAKMATNSGKTEVMAAIIKAIGQKTVLLVHRKELMYQTAERLTKRGIENVGMCGDGIWQPNVVTVAMIQTLYLRKDLPDFADNIVLFSDECHVMASNQAQDVYYRIPGRFRYGVSGTPLKRDDLADLKLLAATGPVIYELSNEFLIENGYSARPIVKIHVIESKSKTKWKMKYQDAYDELIVNNDERNQKIADVVKEIDGTTLILVNRIEHGKTLEKLTGGIFVSGINSTEFRRMVLDSMRNSRGVYIASPIFDEGVDVPGVNAVVLAGGGVSQVKLLQRIGRGLRHKENVNVLTVLDFIDDTNKHLLKQSNARIEVYSEEGFDTVIV